MRRRLLSFVFVAALCVLFAPSAAASDDVWADIQTLIDSRAVLMGEDDAQTEAFFASFSDDVEALVLSRDDTVPGSLRRNGDQVLWKTTDGITKGYDPASRASLAQEIAEEDSLPLQDVPMTSEEPQLFSAGDVPRDVAMIMPFYGLQWQWRIHDYYLMLDMAEATGGSCRWYPQYEATIDALARSLESCCFVSVFTHGGPSLITLTTDKGFTQQDYNNYWVYDEGPSDSAGGGHVWGVTVDAITAHMQGNIPNAFVWFKSCSVLGTGEMCEKLREKGAAVVFGWSKDLWRTGDSYLTWFASSLMEGKTVAESALDMKRAACQEILQNWDESILTASVRSYLESLQYVSWNANHPKHPLSVAQAQQVGAAFMVFVSDQDPYPGSGQVDKPQTVRSTWKLPLAEEGREIQTEVAAGSHMERIFSEADDIRVISGALPSGVTAEVREYTNSSSDYVGSYASVSGTPTVPGLYRAQLRLYLRDGGTKTVKIAVLVTKTTAAESRESIELEPGKSQTHTLSLSVSSPLYGGTLLSGALPDGLTFRAEEGKAPYLTGTPAPGRFTAVLRLLFKDGTVVLHTVDILVPVSIVELNRTMAGRLGTPQDFPFDLPGSDQPVSIEETGGKLPPGMDWECSSGVAPHFFGTPTSAGNYTSKFSIQMPDGRLIRYTTTIRIFSSAGGVKNYTIDLSTGACEINRADFDAYVINSIIAAISSKQIRFRQTSAGFTVLDLDNDGAWDIMDGKSDAEGYVVLHTMSTCSLTGDDFELTLNDDALAWLISDNRTQYAAKLTFHLLDRSDLYIAGTQVTSRNRSDVLGDGVFSFDGVHTLTIRGDYYTDSTTAVIRSAMPDLIIQAEGSVSISGKGSCILASEDLTVKGSGELILQSAGSRAVYITNGARLQVNNTTLWASGGLGGICGMGTGERLSIDRSSVNVRSSSGAVKGFDGGLWLSRCLVAEPLHASAAKPEIRSETGSLLKNVAITPFDQRYGLEINGIPVTDRNRDDILGDGTFSYNVTGRLMIHRDYTQPDGIPYPVIYCSSSGICVQPLQPVTITAPGVCLAVANDSRAEGTLTLRSTGGDAVTVADGAALRISNASLQVTGAQTAFLGSGSARLILEDAELQASGSLGAIRGFGGGIYTYGLVSLLRPEAGSISSGAVVNSGGTTAKEVFFRYYRSFPLRIIGEVVTELNMDDILGNGVFSFDGDHTLTVRGDCRSEFNIIDSSIDGLVICVAEDSALITSSYDEWGMCMGDPILAQADLTITGPGVLTLQSGDFSGIAACYGATVTLRGCELCEPAGASLGDRLIDAEGETLKYAVIAPVYLNVNGDMLEYAVWLPKAPEPAVLVAAWYDTAGRMTGCHVEKAAGSGSVRGTIPAPPGQSEYRLFVCDGQTMEPLGRVLSSGS
jgi:hypothetical protein